MLSLAARNPALEVPVYFGMEVAATADSSHELLLFFSRFDFHATVDRRFQCRCSLPIQQRTDVFQKLVRGLLGVALVFDQSIHDVVDAPELLLIGRLGAGRNLNNVL